MSPLRRFFTFAAVGVSGAVVNTVVLALLHSGLHWPVAAASALATEVAIVNNYLLNDRFTFAAGGATPQRFVRFNLVALGGLAITVATVTALTARTATPVVVANGVGMVLAVAWNFLASVRWTWADTTERPAKTGRLLQASSSI